MTHRDITRARAKEGPFSSDRAKRAIRDADLHKLCKAGRVLLDWNLDGSPKLDKVGNQVVHRVSKSDSTNMITLLTLVKKIAAGDPYYEATDADLHRRAKRDLGPGWSVATVRRTRRLLFLAGFEVRPRVLSEIPGVRERGLTGFVWVLDRRRLALVENAAQQLSRPVTTEEQGSCIRAGEKPLSLRSSGAEKPPPRAGPDAREASAAVKAALRELRSEERRSRRAQPTASERLHQPTLRLVAALFVERWKVRMDWGDAAALGQAAERALALRGDPERVAAARAHLAGLLLGEQLRLEEGDRSIERSDPDVGGGDDGS